MSSSMILPSEVLDIIHRLESFNFEAYIVGGSIRDLYCDRSPNDWDFSTNALPQEILSCFSDCKTYAIGKKHGTITIIWKGKPYEITTYRVDGDYQNARHPSQVKFVQNLTDDLSRRDFTINAMAYHPKSGIIDPFNGLTDLQQGILRTVGDPKRRFSEDALRILRGLRIAACYDMQIENETAQAAISFAHLLQKISGERIFAEFDRLLCAPGKGMTRIFRDFRLVWNVVFPEVTSNLVCWQKILHMMEQTPPDQDLRCAIFLLYVNENDTNTILHRYHVNKNRFAHVRTLIQHYTDPIPSNRKEMRHWIAKLGEVIVSQLLQIHRSKCLAELTAGEWQQLLQAECLFKQISAEKNNCFNRSQLAINGHDLIEIGIKKGPHIGEVLDQLLELVIDETLPNQHDVLLKHAKQL